MLTLLNVISIILLLLGLIALAAPQFCNLGFWLIGIAALVFLIRVLFE